MHTYLSEIFPEEYYIFQKALKFKELGSDPSQALKKYQKKKKISKKIEKIMKKLNKHKLFAAVARKKRAERFIKRESKLPIEEVKYLEETKRTLVFSRSDRKKLLFFLESESGLSLGKVLSCKGLLILISYLLTVHLRNIVEKIIDLLDSTDDNFNTNLFSESIEEQTKILIAKITRRRVLFFKKRENVSLKEIRG